jgi:predicted ATPase with chaperone activity
LHEYEFAGELGLSRELRPIRGALAQQPATAFASSHDDSYPELSDVKGQPQAKRVLEIAAAGQHSLLILCPSIP